MGSPGRDPGEVVGEEGGDGGRDEEVGGRGVEGRGQGGVPERGDTHRRAPLASRTSVRASKNRAALTSALGATHRLFIKISDRRGRHYDTNCPKRLLWIRKKKQSFATHRVFEATAALGPQILAVPSAACSGG